MIGKLKVAAGVVVCCALQLAGPAHAGEGGQGSGFLPDYARLQKAGLPANHYFVYRDRGYTGPAGKKLYVSPIAIYPSGAEFEGVDPAVVTGTLQGFDAALHERVASRVALVEKPGDADLLLEVALTEVMIEQKGKKAVDLIPARAVANVAKDAVLGEALVAATSLEAKLVDAQSGQVLAELVQHSPGKGVGRSGKGDVSVTLEALQPAIHDSARLVAEQILLVK